jgi:hypothetical protein
LSWHEVVECISRWDLVCVGNKVKDIIVSSVNSVRDAAIHAIDMVATGAAMIADDIADFPRLDRPHHWLWGLIFVIIGVVIVALAVIFMVLI